MRTVVASVLTFFAGSGSTWFYFEQQPKVTEVPCAHELDPSETTTTTTTRVKAVSCPAAAPEQDAIELDAISHASKGLQGVVGLMADLTTYTLGVKPKLPAELLQTVSSQVSKKTPPALTEALGKASSLVEPLRANSAGVLSKFQQQFPEHKAVLADRDPLLVLGGLTVILMMALWHFVVTVQFLLNCCCRRRSSGEKSSSALAPGKAAAETASAGTDTSSAAAADAAKPTSGRKSAGGKKAKATK